MPEEKREVFVKQVKTVIYKKDLINLRALQKMHGDIPESAAARHCIQEYFKDHPIPFPNKPNK